MVFELSALTENHPRWRLFFVFYRCYLSCGKGVWLEELVDQNNTYPNNGVISQSLRRGSSEPFSENEATPDFSIIIQQREIASG